MQRIRATTLFIVFTLFMSVMDVSAIDYPEAEAWLNDYAGILSPEQQQELNSVLKDLYLCKGYFVKKYSTQLKPESILGQ